MKYILILCIAFTSVLPINASANSIEQEVLKTLFYLMDPARYPEIIKDDRIPSYYENNNDIPFKFDTSNDGKMMIIHVPVPNSGGMTVPKFIFVDDKK